MRLDSIGIEEITTLTHICCSTAIYGQGKFYLSFVRFSLSSCRLNLTVEKQKKIQIFVLFAHTHIGTVFAHSARLYRGISHNSDTSRGRAEEMHVRLLCFASESFTECVL